MKKFEVETFGKWILAGEHSVLRGSPALVFPLKSRGLRLRYEETADPLKLHLVGSHGAEMEFLFWAVLERAGDLLKVPRAAMRGNLTLESTLPVGAGLGASAAFCVAMSRWFRSMDWLKLEDIGEFAVTLENLFHGESSGVDVAVAMTGEGLHFERSGYKYALAPAWSPRLYISSCGQRGLTSDCVRKVKELIAANPKKGRELDERMMAAVEECEAALIAGEEKGFEKLKNAIESAGTCFKEWGLADGAVAEHERKLREAGAVAVKPTGSGGGGYMLSLWASLPPVSLQGELIACFVPSKASLKLAK